MPTKLIADISALDLTKHIFDKQVIRECNPQRGDMEMLDGIVYCDTQQQLLIGYKDVRNDEFWVSGHIPGRPLLPGVLMIEAGAQLASFYAKKLLGWGGFIGFGGIEECRFRQQVLPPCRLYILCQQVWHRHGRVCCREQGVVDGVLVFETMMVGVKM
jgi:3-hydroxyacyl-[acyl-carrier-protein] dehydratase